MSMNDEQIKIFGTMIYKICSELENIPNKDNPISQIKLIERVLLLKLLCLCPNSNSRQTKSHRAKSDEKKILIHGQLLCRCHINACVEDLEKGESCLDNENKTIVFIKSDTKNPIVFDVSKHWETIEYLKTLKMTSNAKCMLFTNDKNMEYPLYYQNSTKRHIGFMIDYHKFISILINGKCVVPGTLNDMFKALCVYNKQFYKKEKDKEKKTYGGKPKNNESKLSQVQWEEIYNNLGIIPKDCLCGQYGKALYKRCILEKKPQRGLRPFHKEGCTKVLSFVTL